jgi:hypothetical protein
VVQYFNLGHTQEVLGIKLRQRSAAFVVRFHHATFEKLVIYKSFSKYFTQHNTSAWVQTHAVDLYSKSKSKKDPDTYNLKYFLLSIDRL